MRGDSMKTGKRLGKAFGVVVLVFEGDVYDLVRGRRKIASCLTEPPIADVLADRNAGDNTKNTGKIGIG